MGQRRQIKRIVLMHDSPQKELERRIKKHLPKNSITQPYYESMEDAAVEVILFEDEYEEFIDVIMEEYLNEDLFWRSERVMV